MALLPIPSAPPALQPRRRLPLTAVPRLARRTVPLTSSPPKKKVLVPIGLGTEAMEAVILVDVLRRAGADVLVASVEAGLEVEASAGTRLVADACIDSCVGEIFDLVALPGGMPGSARLRDCEILRNMMVKHAEEKRLYGAICAAPAIALKPWGLLKQKQMTGHPAFMDQLPTFWAVKSNVQVSGELTTSRGPGTTFEFALSFVKQMFGDNMGDELGRMLLMHTDGGQQTKEEFNTVEWSFDRIPRGGLVGAERLHKSKVLKKLLKEQNLAGRIFGGICSSPAVLQRQGLLKDKIVTAHPAIVGKLTGQVVEGAKVVIDGKLITGSGLGGVTDFALAIVKKLFGHARARSVAEGIVFVYPKS